MASVSFETVLVAPSDDLAAVVALAANTTDDSSSAQVEVVRYSAGRRRLIRRPGSDVTVNVSAPLVQRSTWLALRDLVGVLVLFRDGRGRRMWGVFGALQASELLGPDLLESVTFTVTEVTVSEVV